MKKVFFILSMILVCSGLLISSISVGFAAEVIEMNLVGAYPERHPVTQRALIPWAKSIEEQSGGRVKIHYYQEGTLVPAKDNYDSTVTGMIDIVGLSGLRTNRFPEMELMALPFIAPSSEIAGVVVLELMKKFPEIKARYNDTKFLSAWASGINQLHTTDKLVKNLDDLKGLRIIGFNSQLVSVINALGANPIELLPPDVYLALQRNTADGVFFPFAPIRAMKIDEVAKNHTVLNLSWGVFHFLMNKKRFSSLPSDIQKIIEDNSGEKISRAVGKVLDGESAAGEKWMKENGHNIYILPDSEKELWFAKLEPVVKEELDKYVNKKGIANAREIYYEAVRLGKEISKNISN